MRHACNWTAVIGQLKGQFKRHACVSEQNASCACAVVSHLAELTVVFVFMKTYNRRSVSYLNFVIVLINW